MINCRLGRNGLVDPESARKGNTADRPGGAAESRGGEADQESREVPQTDEGDEDPASAGCGERERQGH
jgi:hypothetical protein